MMGRQSRAPDHCSALTTAVSVSSNLDIELLPSFPFKWVLPLQVVFGNHRQSIVMRIGYFLWSLFLSLIILVPDLHKSLQTKPNIGL